MKMKKILNEWKRFLNESKQSGILADIIRQDDSLKINDPEVTAIYILHALKGNDSEEVVKHIANNSDKVLDILSPENFASGDLLKITAMREQNFLARRTDDVYAVVPEFEYDMEVRTYPDLETLNGFMRMFTDMVRNGPAAYNFSELEADIGTGGTGRSLEYRGSGGASSTGYYVPWQTSDEEKETLAKMGKKYLDMHLYRGFSKDNPMTREDHREAIELIHQIYDFLIYLFQKYRTDEHYYVMLSNAKKKINKIVDEELPSIEDLLPKPKSLDDQIKELKDEINQLIKLKAKSPKSPKEKQEKEEASKKYDEAMKKMSDLRKQKRMEMRRNRGR